jgi:hypothetical protein
MSPLGGVGERLDFNSFQIFGVKRSERWKGNS